MVLSIHDRPCYWHGKGEIVLCKSWVQKQWKHVRKFTKKHKKVLIIGAVVVVAAAVIVVAVVAAAPAAGAAATSDSNKSDKKEQKKESSSASSVPADISLGMAATSEISHR